MSDLEQAADALDRVTALRDRCRTAAATGDNDALQRYGESVRLHAAAHAAFVTLSATTPNAPAILAARAVNDACNKWIGRKSSQISQRTAAAAERAALADAQQRLANLTRRLPTT
ncbi:hypothetical protein [Rhodoblastus sp.]|jgi:hypothetical protein|uniref:hypothetical protein n=1 Tax=Rhodoblastus sp. TaxID=1962975 RepID=UPI002600FFB5|nr:hypothetical protein [Rhodoblastus sp.]